MIAHDDIVITFHKGDASFVLKIAVRSGARSAPEVFELLRAVVQENVTMSYVIDRSRFSPNARRMRERVTSFFDSTSQTMAPVAAATKETPQPINDGKVSNIVHATRPRGRPKSVWNDNTNNTKQ